MKTAKQRNMVNRGMKLAIGDELETVFNPVVSATKQAAEETERAHINEENTDGYRWSCES